nr:hypothetical protein L203_04234 [Cryptococcus depauperatus CBS 7841]
MSNSTTAPGGSGLVSQQDGYRLPNSVYPNHYDLAIKTDLLSSPPTFSGETLSITDIAISTSDLKTTSSVVIPKEVLELDEELEMGTIPLEKILGGGLKENQKDVKIFFRFEAELKGAMHGYYRSQGDADENGKKPM